jgi:hypothetical protein
MAFGVYKKMQDGIRKVGGWMERNVSRPVIKTFENFGHKVADALGIKGIPEKAGDRPNKPKWQGASSSGHAFTDLLGNMMDESYEHSDYIHNG